MLASNNLTAETTVTACCGKGITKAESRTLIDAAHHAKGRLCRKRVGAPVLGQRSSAGYFLSVRVQNTFIYKTGYCLRRTRRRSLARPRD
jgi:hypothetical protein